MIPKEKLKVGKLYKTKNTNGSGVVAYRVWLGDRWSLGTSKPEVSNYILYSKGWQNYESAEPLFLRSTSFKKLSTNSFVHDSTMVGSTFKFYLKPQQVKKPIRYLNRPEETV